ncbi:MULTISPECIES: gamma carbonic anhydrase family protein [unclassified Crossiella]|uniref:gamma carbonic anhydrase family protein n=1 Tax=Crossiella sp. SN42 TaxID=2944808 RepID=UPI00207D65DB|nr:gamma carbonic anhydrase family protein [Crossiella sp. SN42]MCO1582463.1 gamma carbonic anhydrase family protein [Crossiella sp. SN42]
MAVYALGDLEPVIHETAYVHPDAVVIGNVTLGPQVSVWPTAVLRGDYGRIEVGERSNVQDGTIIHCTQIHPTLIGAGCVVGHNVHIEGATIGDGCLIGSGSVVLNGAVVEDGAIVGAGAVVSHNGHVPARRLAVGVPAKVKPDFEVPENAVQPGVDMYVANIKVYRDGLRRLD